MRKIALVLFGMMLSVCACSSAQVLLPSFLTPKPGAAQKADVNADTVILYTAVTDASAHDVVEAIERDNRVGDATKPITLYINSPGGGVDAGGMIIDAMTASHRPVYTVIVKEADSMGAFIFEYGVKRFILRHAVVMFHYESGGYSGYVKHIASEVASAQRKFADFEEHIAKRVGVSVSDLQVKEANEWYLMGQDAVDAHAADGIREARDFPVPTDPK